MPHDDCEQRKLQCSQDDAEIYACSESDCILDELGRCSEVLIADDLAGVVVRMDEFALSALSRESAFISSSQVSVFKLPCAGRDNRDLIQCNCFVWRLWSSNIHARRDAMSGFLFVVAWVVDRKTNFETSYAAVLML